MKTYFRNCAAALLACAIAVPATAAIASPVVAKAVAQVKTNDLDLASAEGRANLDKRIDRAARSVCTVDSHGQARSRSEEAKCRSMTLAAVKAHFAAGA